MPDHTANLLEEFMTDEPLQVPNSKGAVIDDETIKVSNVKS